MRRTALMTLLCAAVLASCGLPADDHVRVIDNERVPYHLLDQPDAKEPTMSTDAAPALGSRVFWVDDQDKLVGVSAPCNGDLPGTVAGLVDALSTGPSDDDRASGLTTALPPGTALKVVAVADGQAELDIGTDQSVPSDRLPLAIGQVVLTVTSVAGVDRVALTHGGQPVQVALPNGVLAGGQLQASDYASVVSNPAELPGPEETAPRPAACVTR